MSCFWVGVGLAPYTLRYSTQLWALPTPQIASFDHCIGEYNIRLISNCPSQRFSFEVSELYFKYKRGNHHNILLLSISIRKLSPVLVCAISSVV